MQGNRDDGIEDGSRKVRVEVRDGEPKEWLLEVQLPAVFEEMNRLAQGPFVTPDGAGVIERGRMRATRATPIFRAVCQGHRRPKRLPTAGAVWWRNETDLPPARLAETPRLFGSDGLSTLITMARQDDVDQSTADPPQRPPHLTPPPPRRLP